MKKDTKKTKTVPVPEGLPKKPPKAMALFMGANKGLPEQSSSSCCPSLACKQNIMNVCLSILYLRIIKGSLDEKLPSYEVLKMLRE